MSAPCKSGVVVKTSGSKAAKAGPRPQRSGDTDNKTIVNEEEKSSEKNPEVCEDGANVTKKDGPGRRSQSDPYAISFRKVMAGWMLVNFPDENSLVNRDEESAINTSTKRYWQKFCEQTQNKKMVASWMEFAREIRTADGLLEFRPAFKNITVSISPGGHLHPLISFPSMGEFKDKTNATLGRQDDDDDDADGYEEEDLTIRPLAAAGNKRKPVAPTKRPRQSVQGEDDDGSGEDADLAKKARKERTAWPSPASSRPTPSATQGNPICRVDAAARAGGG